MKKYIEQLVATIKKQAEIFLLDAGEFFPFGVYINDGDKIIPVGAFIEDENDRPSSLELIELLEKSFREKITDGQCIAGAVAIDAAIKENGVSYDVIEIRFFESNKEYKSHFKYSIKKDYVEFS